MRNRIFKIILPLLFFCLLGTNAFAVTEFGGEVPAIQDSTNVTYVKNSKGTMDPYMKKFREKHSLDKTNFAVTYYNLFTGESYTYNDQKYFDSVNLERLPICMYMYDLTVEGKLSWKDEIGSSTVNYLVKDALSVDNNKKATEILTDYLGGYGKMKGLIAPYSTDEYGNVFRSEKVLNTRYMSDVIKRMYEDARGKFDSSYLDDIVYPIRDVNEGRYFSKYVLNYSVTGVDGKSGDTYGAADVVGTPQSYVLAAFVEAENGEEILADLNKTVCDYNVNVVSGQDGKTTTKYTTSSQDIPDSQKKKYDDSLINPVAKKLLICAVCAVISVLVVLVLLYRKKTREKYNQ